MMKTAHQIIKVQDELKKLYGEDGYTRVISSITEKTHGDIKILSEISKDVCLGSTVRLFAIAAMGE